MKGDTGDLFRGRIGLVGLSWIEWVEIKLNGMYIPALIPAAKAVVSGVRD